MAQLTRFENIFPLVNEKNTEKLLVQGSQIIIIASRWSLISSLKKNGTEIRLVFLFHVFNAKGFDNA